MAKNWRSRDRMNDPELGTIRPDAQLKLDVGDALNELKALDPTGWERWYDRVVPSTAKYPEILTIVQARVSTIKHRQAVQAYAAALQPAPRQMANTGILNALKALETGELPQKGA